MRLIGAAGAVRVAKGTGHRWRQEHGGLKGSQARRVKGLGLGRQRRRGAVAAVTPETLILGQAGGGAVQARRAGGPVPSTKPERDPSERRAGPALWARALGPRSGPALWAGIARPDARGRGAQTMGHGRQGAAHGRPPRTGPRGWARRPSHDHGPGGGCSLEGGRPRRVERLWRHEGLKAPAQTPRTGRLWRADGLCVRVRPKHRNPAWAHGVVEDRTPDDRRVRRLNGEVLHSRREAQVVLERGPGPYGIVRPHASLGRRPPAPEVLLPALAAQPVGPVRPAPHGATPNTTPADLRPPTRTWLVCHAAFALRRGDLLRGRCGRPLLTHRAQRLGSRFPTVTLTRVCHGGSVSKTISSGLKHDDGLGRCHFHNEPLADDTAVF